MKSIEITADNKRAVFTPRAVELDGVVFEYASLLVIRHRPADHVYLISDGRRLGSVSYREEDAAAVRTLFSRIAQLRNIRIEETGSASETVPAEEPDAAPAQTVPSEPTEKDAAAAGPQEQTVAPERTGLLQRPVFIFVEAAAALALIAIGIYLLFFAY